VCFKIKSDCCLGSRESEEVMTKDQYIRVLTINSGSSSLKFALYDMGQNEQVILSGAIDGINFHTGCFHIKDAHGDDLINQSFHVSDHEIAAVQLLRWLKKHDYSEVLDAVGHRIVHGGSKYYQPYLVNSKLMEELQDLIPLSPDHLPQELKVIRTVGQYHPKTSQIVCFDTAFHHSMPKQAQIFALPKSLKEEGIMRYGFHGLSYEYIIEKLKTDVGKNIANGRIIIAHLGNGASMVATKRGRSIDTTMGFTPTGGLMMSTRSGDLDPGVILYLLRQKNLRPSEVADIVNKKAGLLGISQISPDMKERLEKKKNPDAAEAVNLFCYQAKKFLGSLVTVLGGLDTLIFTGGIGENSPPIRKCICENMELFGIRLDTNRNARNAPVISDDHSTVTVRVMKTNEQLMIARHTRNCLLKKKRKGIS
jgi:acetate kinase